MWKLLLIVVTESLLDPVLKYINLDEGNKVIQSQQKTLQTSQMYSNLTIKTPE